MCISRGKGAQASRIGVGATDSSATRARCRSFLRPTKVLVTRRSRPRFYSQKEHSPPLRPAEQWSSQNHVQHLPRLCIIDARHVLPSKLEQEARLRHAAERGEMLRNTARLPSPHINRERLPVNWLDMQANLMQTRMSNEMSERRTTPRTVCQRFTNKKTKTQTLNEDSSATHLVRVSSQVHSHSLLTHDCDADERECESTKKERRQPNHKRSRAQQNKQRKQINQTKKRAQKRTRETSHTHPLSLTHTTYLSRPQHPHTRSETSSFPQGDIALGSAWRHVIS